MFDIREMGLDDWASCGRALTQASAGAESMEEVAQRIVTRLYDRLLVPDTDSVLIPESASRACVLVRLYKTHSYRGLPVSLMDYVDSTLGKSPDTLQAKCLTLLGTAGDAPDWNHRTLSVGHQAIPLLNEEMVRRIPMVARLVEQLGLETKAILDPDPALILSREQEKHPVFYVGQAAGSPYIPAQESFVVPHRIRSVVGFGGVLPSGDLFAVILFSRVFVPRTIAEEFARLALPVKIALLPYTSRNVFAAE